MLDAVHGEGWASYYPADPPEAVYRSPERPRNDAFGYMHLIKAHPERHLLGYFPFLCDQLGRGGGTAQGHQDVAILLGPLAAHGMSRSQGCRIFSLNTRRMSCDVLRMANTS